jgi:predicted DNA-binding transcriptional regulator AlpA
MSASLDSLPPELAQKRVLGTRQAAAFVGLSVPEWERRRAAGKTPTPVQLGTRKLGYTVESLIAWIKARQQQAPGQAA